MPGPYADAYGPSQQSAWYHFSSGSALADIAILGGIEEGVKAFSGRGGMLGAGGELGKVSNWMGRLLEPGGMAGGSYYQKLATNKFHPGIRHFAKEEFAAQYFGKGGIFNSSTFLRDSHRGVGVFTGGRTAASVVGKRAATRITAGAMLTLGVRTAFTAMNFGLGISLGRGIGDIIANYETNKPNQDITLESGGFFADTRAGFTQRQQAIQTIHNSQLTTRAALGNEASFLHQ